MSPPSMPRSSPFSATVNTAHHPPPHTHARLNAAGESPHDQLGRRVTGRSGLDRSVAPGAVTCGTPRSAHVVPETPLYTERPGCQRRWSVHRIRHAPHHAARGGVSRASLIARVGNRRRRDAMAISDQWRGEVAITGAAVRTSSPVAGSTGGCRSRRSRPGWLRSGRTSESRPSRRAG